jgi:AcrR family transcriptional regulator
MPSGQRRKAIVEAAIRLFAKNGFRGTTTRQLAQAVGVSEPVLYMHFATKRELYGALIETLAEGVQKASCDLESREGNDEEFFFRLAEMMLRWYTDDPSRIRILLYSALEGHELSDLFYQKQIAPFLEAFAAYIRRRVEEGAFRELDPRKAARAFCSMIGNYGQGLVIFRFPEPEESREQTLREMVRIFLNGVRLNGVRLPK